MTRGRYTRSDQAAHVPQGPAHVPSLPRASVSLDIFSSPGVPDPTFCWSLEEAMIPWERHGAALAYAAEALGAAGWTSESVTWFHSKKGGIWGQAQDETASPTGGVGGLCFNPHTWPLLGRVSIQNWGAGPPPWDRGSFSSP